MENLKVTPELIQELQKFEEKKDIYTLAEDLNTNTNRIAADEEKQKKTFKYYFQHPYARLIVPSAVTILNVYQFAEDPISLSVKDCHIAGFGNLYSLIFSNYPPDGVSALKVFLWIFGFIFGIIFGKIVIHYWLFCRKFKLKIFTKEGQGSWIVTFFTTCCVLFYQSTVYNSFLDLIGPEYNTYHCTSNLHIEYGSMMKGAAVATWLGDFFTVWMVLDTMLQEKKYIQWMPKIRLWWSKSYTRVVLFWFACISFSVVMITGITTDFLNWEHINQDFITTNELSRSFLASGILILDLVIIMQDWDFPHFSSTTNLKLPGFFSKGISLPLPQRLSVYNNEVTIEGKWFNYGILFIVIVLDLYQWKNQIYYVPVDYGQYVDNEGRIYTVMDRHWLETANKSQLKIEGRINQTDHRTTSKFLGYPVTAKGTAFLPAIFAFFAFVYIVSKYADDESEQEKMVKEWYESKFTKKRRSRRVRPITVQPQEDSDSEDEDIESPIIEKLTSTKFTYYYQHPYVRLATIYSSVFLSWFVIAEDPIGHSHKLAKADIIGNIYNLIFSKYPVKGEYIILKVLTWVIGTLFGIYVGKVVLHRILFNKILRLKLFKKGQGSWTVTFLTTIIMLYCFSLLFNHVTELDTELKEYYISNEMDIKYTTFMKGVGLFSFFSHFLFVMMVTDLIFQEKHYPTWAKFIRKLWTRKYLRVIVMWIVGISIPILAILIITTGYFEYESISSTSTNELGRVCLAASIVMSDILILTQDWEFPRFKLSQSIKLPGLTVSEYHFKMCFLDFEIKGKWFTYSLMGAIMFVDCYNYKNQLWYKPINYQQFVDQNNYIVSYIPSKQNATVFTQERINAKFESHAEDAMYSLSLLLILSALIFSFVYGVIRSRQIQIVENKMKVSKLKNVPKVEDIKIVPSGKYSIKLKPLGNMKNIHST